MYRRTIRTGAKPFLSGHDGAASRERSACWEDFWYYYGLNELCCSFDFWWRFFFSFIFLILMKTRRKSRRMFISILMRYGRFLRVLKREICCLRVTRCHMQRSQNVQWRHHCSYWVPLKSTKAACWSKKAKVLSWRNCLPLMVEMVAFISMFLCSSWFFVLGATRIRDLVRCLKKWILWLV